MGLRVLVVVGVRCGIGVVITSRGLCFLSVGVVLELGCLRGLS